MMVELFINRLKGPGQFGEVHDPARLFLHRSGDVNFNPERMAMQSPTLVVFRHVWQEVRRFDRKNLEYFHVNNRTEKTLLTRHDCT